MQLYMVYVPGWHCAHHFVVSFFHSSLICLTISHSLFSLFLFFLVFLSFFLALLMLCLINLYCFSYSFLSFVYFNFGIIRRFGECRMCPKLFFFFYFGFWGFVFRFSGSFAQHKINTHSTSALNK